MLARLCFIIEGGVDKSRGQLKVLLIAICVSQQDIRASDILWGPLSPPPQVRPVLAWKERSGRGGSIYLAERPATSGSLSLLWAEATVSCSPFSYDQHRKCDNRPLLSIPFCCPCLGTPVARNGNSVKQVQGLSISMHPKLGATSEKDKNWRGPGVSFFRYFSVQRMIWCWLEFCHTLIINV